MVEFQPDWVTDDHCDRFIHEDPQGQLVTFSDCWRVDLHAVLS